MTYFRIIAFLAFLGVAVGVNGYLDKQYNVSIFSAIKGINIGDFVKKLVSPPKFNAPGQSGNLPSGVSDYKSCNSTGTCENPNEICHPVSVNNQTELRCVPGTPPPPAVRR